MNNNTQIRAVSPLNKTIRILLLIVLIGVIAYFGKPVLAPLLFAALLSMLLLPLVERLTAMGWSKVLAILSSILVLVLFFGIVISVLVWQVSNMAKETTNIEQKVTKAVQNIKNKITGTIGLPPSKQKELVSSESTSPSITRIMASLGGIVVNAVLMLVYIFLFLFYRSRLKRFIFKLVPDDKESNTRTIIEDGRKVAQKYLSGLALMIGCLWVLYGIGFSIVGIENPLFFALLCGTLEIVPFFGNLLGSSLTAAFTIIQGGSLTMVLGVLFVYGVVQFVQTYILETMIVGRGVNINPLFTIISLVAGEFIWGIAGMVIAIPLMGITKIACDHIEPLKPVGELLGDKKEDSKRLTNRFHRLLTGNKKDQKGNR